MLRGYIVKVLSEGSKSWLTSNVQVVLSDNLKDAMVFYGTHNHVETGLDGMHEKHYLDEWFDLDELVNL